MFVVTAPFTVPDGDLVLRSSDLVSFRVWRTVLILASPFFRDMFALPQPAQQNNTGNADELPIVDVSEDAETLDALLRICYPIKAQRLADLCLAHKVLAAALKYDIAVVVQDICQLLVTVFAQKQPLAVYAIACRYKLVDEARMAAKASLRIPITGLYVEELEDISAGDLFRLLEYRRNAAAAILPLRSDQYLNLPRLKPQTRTTGCTYHRPCLQEISWQPVLMSAETSLRDAPLCNTVFSLDHLQKGFGRYDAYSQLLPLPGCSHCQEALRDGWQAITELLLKEVESKVDEVELATRGF